MKYSVDRREIELSLHRDGNNVILRVRDYGIGIRPEQAVARFLTARPQRFEPEKEGFVFSSIYVEVDPASGRALSVWRETIVEESGD
jgi:calcineurin-like phosphoesterase